MSEETVMNEMALVGSVLMDPERVMPLLMDARAGAEWFADGRCKTAWRGLRQMWDENRLQGVDMLTLADALKRVKPEKGEDAPEIDVAWVQKLIDDTPTAAHAEHYIVIVRNQSLCRKGKRLAQGFSAALETGPALAVQKFQAGIVEIMSEATGAQDAGLASTGDKVMQTFKDAHRIRMVEKRMDYCPGVPMPWRVMTANYNTMAFHDCVALKSVTFASSPPPDDGDIYQNSPGVTNYVTNPQATGWGATFGGKPVVRLPLYADAVYESHTSIIGTGDKASEVAGEGMFADGTEEDLGAGFKKGSSSQQSTGIAETLGGVAQVLEVVDRIKSGATKTRMVSSSEAVVQDVAQDPDAVIVPAPEPAAASKPNSVVTGEGVPVVAILGSRATCGRCGTLWGKLDPAALSEALCGASIIDADKTDNPGEYARLRPKTTFAYPLVLVFSGDGKLAGQFSANGMTQAALAEKVRALVPECVPK